MTKRPEDKRDGPGGHAEERKRQFEESRGLGERRSLDLDEAETEEEAEPPEPPDEGERQRDEGE
jgi:hypothetical protein